MIFLFPRWDMLIPWRVMIMSAGLWKYTIRDPISFVKAPSPYLMAILLRLAIKFSKVRLVIYHWNFVASNKNNHLGGGWTNPSEKYDRQIGWFPQVGVKIKKTWKQTQPIVIYGWLLQLKNTYQSFQLSTLTITIHEFLWSRQPIRTAQSINMPPPILKKRWHQHGINQINEATQAQLVKQQI